MSVNGSDQWFAFDAIHLTADDTITRQVVVTSRALSPNGSDVMVICGSDCCGLKTIVSDF